MCGIAGVIDLRGNPREELIFSVKKMLQMITHRGPDSTCTIEPSEGIVLGYNRLRITDHLNTLADSPPMSADGRYSLLFNGELYDYESRREDLLKRGIAFKTRSDSEVFLNSWALAGDSFLSSARGMFAACLADSQKRSLTLAVDHFGQKPLYYLKTDKAVWFCSEIKPLLTVPGTDLTYDLDSIIEFVHQRYIRGSDTQFKNIKKLRAGEKVEIDSKGITSSFYYRLPVGDEKRASKESIYQSIHSSCDLVSKTEIPSVVLLSGGLDSSIVLYELVKLKRPVQVLSVRFAPEVRSEAMIEESASSAELVKLLNVEASEITFTASDYFKWLEKWLGAIQVPIGCQEGPCNLALLSEVSSRFRVAFCGTGPDEALDGYRQVALLPEGMESFVRRFTGSYGWHFSVDLSALVPNKDLQRIPVTKLKQDLQFVDSSITESLRWTQFANISGRLPTLELSQMDIAGMQNSVEVRSPLVDADFFERALSLKVNDCRVGEVDKAILREIYRGKLPDSVIDQNKHGFPISEKLWDTEEFRPFAQSVMEDGSKLDRLGIFDMNYMREIWKRNLKGDRNMFFRLLVLERGLRVS